MKMQLLSPPISVRMFGIGNSIEAIYIGIKKGKVAKSIPVGKQDEAVIDINGNGEILGIELLEPVTLEVRMIKKISEQYKIANTEALESVNRLQNYFSHA